MHKVIAENIQTHGRHLFGIFDPERNLPIFCYTVGNALVGMPELIIVGNLDMKLQGMILNAISDHQVSTGVGVSDGLLDINWTYPFKIHTPSESVKTEYTLQAGNFLGHSDYQVRQVMICDTNGVYPDEDGFDTRYNIKPL